MEAKSGYATSIRPPHVVFPRRSGDLHCRVVARTNEHLQEVLGEILVVPGIVRTARTLMDGVAYPREYA